MRQIVEPSRRERARVAGTYAGVVAIAALAVLLGAGGGSAARAACGATGAVAMLALLRKGLNRKTLERIAFLLGIASTLYAFLAVAYRMVDTPRHGIACPAAARSRHPDSADRRSYR
jgi:hypothetical protein